MLVSAGRSARRVARDARRAVGIPSVSECIECRRAVLAEVSSDAAVMVEIEVRGPKWAGVRLLEGATSLLTSQPGPVGATVTTFDPGARRWSNLETVRFSRT
jgi:hypothetical protein